MMGAFGAALAHLPARSAGPRVDTFQALPGRGVATSVGAGPWAARGRRARALVDVGIALVPEPRRAVLAWLAVASTLVQITAPHAQVRPSAASAAVAGTARYFGRAEMSPWITRLAVCRAVAASLASCSACVAVRPAHAQPAVGTAPSRACGRIARLRRSALVRARVAARVRQGAVDTGLSSDAAGVGEQPRGAVALLVATASAVGCVADTSLHGAVHPCLGRCAAIRGRHTAVEIGTLLHCGSRATARNRHDAKRGDDATDVQTERPDHAAGLPSVRAGSS